MPEDIYIIIIFEDFDGSSKLVETRALNTLEANQVLQSSRARNHAAMICRAQHSYPALVEIIIRAEERDLPAGLSDFDI